MREEIDAFQRLYNFDDDEVLLGVLRGTVHGLEANTRQGILFFTTTHIGVFASAGFFTQDALVCAHFSQVKRYWKEGTGALYVETFQGVVSVREARDGEPNPTEFFRLLDIRLNSYIREDLFQFWEAALSHLDTERTDQVQLEIAKILRATPSCFPAMIIREQNEILKGNSESAIIQLEKLIEDGADKGWCLGLITEAANGMSDWDRVIQSTTRSIELDSTDPFAFSQRAVAFREKGDYAAARRDSQVVTKLAPDDVNAWNFAAHIGKEIGNLNEVKRCADQLKRLGHEQYFLYWETEIAESREDWTETERLAEAYFHSGGREPSVAISHLGATDELGKETISLLARYDEFHCENPSYQFVSALVLLNQGELRAARDRISSWEDIDFPLVRLTCRVIECAELMTAQRYSDLIAHIEGFQHTGGNLDGVEQKSFYMEFWKSLRIYLANAYFHTSQFDKAAEIVSQLEDGRKTYPRDLGAQVPKLIEDINLALGRSEFGAQVSAYELLSKLSDALVNSGRHADLEHDVRQMLVEFDQPPLVAVMGEYSVGKSTFINALLGQDLLPSGEGVTTGTITWLRHAESEYVRVIFRNGTVKEFMGLRSVSDVVRESEEGGTAQKVRHVEVFLNADILRFINIVDTPGLNAPFPEHIKTTEEFLEKADAVLFLFNVETAGKASERDFLVKLGDHRRKAVGIVNQIDLVPRDEVEEVLEDIAKDFGGVLSHVLGVSGWVALQGRLTGDEAKVQRSRLPQMESWLNAQMLEPARDIKRTAQFEKIREMLAEVKVARANFDSLATKGSNQLEAVKKDFQQWHTKDVTVLLDQMGKELKRDVEIGLRTLAAEIAQASSRQGLAEQGLVSARTYGLLNVVSESWFRFESAILNDFNRVFGHFLTSLKTLHPEINDKVLVRKFVELESLVDSWKKDLTDYMEGIREYAKGFFDANGVWTFSILAIPDDQYNNIRVIQPLLEANLEFLHARPEDIALRWLNEIRLAFLSAVEELSATYSQIVSATRQVGFGNIERMSSVLPG